MLDCDPIQHDTIYDEYLSTIHHIDDRWQITNIQKLPDRRMVTKLAYIAGLLPVTMIATSFFFIALEIVTATI